MPSRGAVRDAEIERVARQLDELMDKLDVSVAALKAILSRPARIPPEADERLATP